MSSQIPLHIGLRDSATLANFLPAGNAQLIEQVQQCAGLQGGRFIYIHGNSGSGKSHLLQAACHIATQAGSPVLYLPMQQRQNFSIKMLDGLEHMSLLCIDDIDAIVGDDEWEVAMFHLYNRAREAGGRLIVTASRHPKEASFKLADLESRLVCGLLFRLQPLNDEELFAALQLRASRRGFDLPDEVVAYLLKHCRRDMNTLFDLLERLDHESLAAQRKLTIPFVKQFI